MAVESTLEVLDIATMERRTVYRAPYHFEAPNWSRDGKFFLFNSEGRLYRIGSDGGEPERIDTWPLHKLNNDHGLSPGGSLIAVSDESDPDGKSRIHVLHIDGRSARLVTEDAPSYWHGWSPDGLTLAYVAARGGGKSLNIYTVPATGGAERRLTDAPGGSVISKLPSSVRASGLAKTRCSSVRASRWRCPLSASVIRPLDISHSLVTHQASP